MERERGTVAFFNSAKGWGFLKRPNKPDCFVHFSAIQADGYKQLREGEHVEFSVIQGEKGPQAADVVVLSSPHA